MKLSRLFPIAAFAVGAVIVAAAAACGGGDDKPAPTAPATERQQAASETPAATGTATTRPTEAPTPTPSPTPYNGSITKFKMPRLGIDAPIEEMGLNAAGELDTPRNENRDVAWYHLYDKPGRPNPDNLGGWQQLGGLKTSEYKGNSVFSAHIYYHETPAPFVNLQRAAIGDEVSAVMQDGREYKYKVIAGPTVVLATALDANRMAQLIWPSNKPVDKEWLTMISCGGQFDPVTREYYSRVIVIAERFE